MIQHPIRALALAAALAVSPVAFAVSIPGLVNTGAGLGADQADPNYSFARVAGTGPLSGAGIVAADGGLPFPFWIANTSTSQWLALSTDQTASYDSSSNGVYRWTLNFDLTGYVASTASFSGRWAADNNGTLRLNGTVISTTTSGTSGHQSWTNIPTVSSGFLAGVNTLSFEVTNLGNGGLNPTGLRAEFTSNVTPVPEPESYALMLAGLGAIGMLARRRRQSR